MTEETQYSIKHQQMLRELKNTVEGLLVSQVANVWSVYGGLNRLHSAAEKIFKQGCVASAEYGVSGYWAFIQGLEWLQPESTKSYLCVDCEYRPDMPVNMKADKASVWLYRSLENHSLSQKLSWLLSDKEHLKQCYQPYAFLQQENYAEAMLLCLRAVERNQPGLMSEINPCLFLSKVGAREFHKLHRRCSSFPDSHLQHCEVENSSRQVRSNTIGDIAATKLPILEKKHVWYGKIKPWSSMPCLYTELCGPEKRAAKTSCCKTTPSTPVSSRYISKCTFKLLTLQNSPKRKLTANSKTKAIVIKRPNKAVKHVVIDNQAIVEHTPPLSSSQSSDTYVNNEKELAMFSTKSLPPTSKDKSPIRKIMSLKAVPDYARSTQAGQKDYKRHPKKSFIESGGMSTQPVATGYFPRPVKGQSLTSFLTSNQFSRANAELDRENAHFNISEAMISAMEQIRCKRDVTLADEHMEDSDPEIMDLKQRIRLRRRQKLVEMQRKMWAASLLSDGRTDTTTTEASLSPNSSTADSMSDSISTDDVEDLEIDEASNLKDNNGLSVSMASLYSDADVYKKPRGAPDGASDILTAESVALSLISRFNEKQLPKASDLEWLVSEEDAPQALLPLPKSFPVSPDDADDVPATPLRGTQEWAPPRPQIIFTLHPTPDRQILISKQNYRCAGCSMKVAPKYASRFRYCDYLGRYFCTGCHTNQLALIPARVLQKWDFTRYPVSNFSYRLLEEMYTDPLFRVFEVNKNIGKRSKNLLFCRKYRLGLFYLKDFVMACRYAENIQETLKLEMPNAIIDPEMYSLEDLVKVRSGEMKDKLKYVVEVCCRHTTECELCLARGFICGVCKDQKVIFPWQMRSVVRCSKCGACYHVSCWKCDKPCPRCERITKRLNN